MFDLNVTPFAVAPVSAEPSVIPAGCSIRTTPKIVCPRRLRHKHFNVVECNTVMLKHTQGRIIRPYQLFRAAERRSLEAWWRDVLRDADIGVRLARRYRQWVNWYGDPASLNLLTGYYGKRRRGHRLRAPKYWAFWKRPQDRTFSLRKARGFVKPNYHATMWTSAMITHKVERIVASHVIGMEDGADPVERMQAIYALTNGQCYDLFVLLRSYFPDAQPWYDNILGHVYTRIGPLWYDVRGAHEERGHLVPLTHSDGHRPHRWFKNSNSATSRFRDLPVKVT